MEEQTKKMITLVVAALLVVALVFGVIFYFRNRTTDTASVQQPTEQPVSAESPPQETVATEEQPAQPAVQQNPPTDSKDAQLRRFCIDFVARFGTYSSDGKSENLKQLLPSMSGSLKTWAQGVVTSATASSEKFSGVTTKALSAKIISQSGGSAIVEVSTQRTFVEGGETRISYETATVSLTSSGTWYVDSVKWMVRPE